MNNRLYLRAIMIVPILSGLTSLRAQLVFNNYPSSNSTIQAAFTEDPMTLETPTGVLYGTLALPKSKAACPVVLIIAGSGPTNRDGNSAVISGANNSNKMLAEGLAGHGIASLRYDKRGIGESAKAMTQESDLRFETYIEDAVLWGRKLRADPRFSTLTIIGHSEGSLIGMVAAQRLPADAYVSIAGVGRPANQLILEQVKPKLPPDLLKATEAALTTLAAGKTLETFPPQLAALFRPSVQPYMISWFRYDPAKEIAKLSVPVLIIQGTTDLQVAIQDAKLLSQASPSAKLVLIEGMNHVLKEVSNDLNQQAKSYGDPSLPVAPLVITETATFANKVKKLKP